MEGSERPLVTVFIRTSSSLVIDFIRTAMGKGAEREIYPGPDGKDVVVYPLVGCHVAELRRGRKRHGDAFDYRSYVLRRNGRLARAKQHEAPLTPHGETVHEEALKRHQAMRSAKAGARVPGRTRRPSGQPSATE